MDPNRLDSLVRALFTTPSRRVVNRVLAGLTAGSILAPFLRMELVLGPGVVKSAAAFPGGHRSVKA